MPLIGFALILQTSAMAQFGSLSQPELVEAGHEEVLRHIAELRANVVVVNMWATWCAPCVQEFPGFVRLARAYEDSGLSIVFVSMDLEEDVASVHSFLLEQGWDETSFRKTGKDDPFIAAFSSDWSGALPATFVYGRDGVQVDSWESGPIEYEELTRRIAVTLR